MNKSIGENLKLFFTLQLIRILKSGLVVSVLSGVSTTSLAGVVRDRSFIMLIARSAMVLSEKAKSWANH